MSFDKHKHNQNLKQLKIIRNYIPILLLIYSLFCLQTVYSTPLDSIKKYPVTKIILTGNKVTKDKIIYRELSFKLFDSLTTQQLNEKIAQSRENLLKTPLFNYVTFDYNLNIDSCFEVSILFEERWYIWPQVTFQYADRNFSVWLKNKDFTKVNLGLGMQRYNFRGCNESIKFKIVFGFNKAIYLLYDGFYIDKKRNHSIGSHYAYIHQNQVAYKTQYNKPVTYKEDEDVLETQEFSLFYMYRSSLNSKHILMYQYYYYKTKDTVTQLNPDYFINSGNNLHLSVLQYDYRGDWRDSRSYPLRGTFIRIFAKKYGLSPLDDLNFLTLKVSCKKYFELIPKYIFYANELTGKFTIGKNKSYYIQESLGFNDFIRGYEYYVIDGEHYVLFKNNLKYQLLQQRIVYLKFIPLPQFKKIYYSMFINFYADIGYAYENSQIYKQFSNTLVNNLLYSSGIGIDFATYYDRVVGVNFSINRMKETGIFIHFKSSI